MKCRNCQTDLLEGSRFCMVCGQPVMSQTKSDAERFSRLAANVPSPLADKMRAFHLAGTRKVVTIMFADVVNSTAMAERLDPEEWTQVMNGLFDRISPVIYKYEGTIAHLLGDALVAFFGAPVAHEDDPRRAVHAALGVLEQAQAYAQDAQKQFNLQFAIRIGLNTGSVVVTEVGNDLKYEYTAMGDAVNLAARMQSAAKPMTVMISQNTYRYVAAYFECQDLGWIEVKGRSAPVCVYQVLRARESPDQAPASQTSMVGREDQLDRLIQASRSCFCWGRAGFYWSAESPASEKPA